MTSFDLTGQGWLQLRELGLAFVLSALVGIEREFRQKSAGLRTYTLVGVSSALFMLISKYGFTDVLAEGRIVLDPSRVAAQIVSGIGFIGGGVIFMRRDVVKGLTTAASVWLTAALGMACGAGLPILAVATTALHVIIMFGLPKLAVRLPRQGATKTRLLISYEDGRGLLRSILVTCSTLGFGIDHVEIERDGGERGASTASGTTLVALRMEVRCADGRQNISHLISALADIDGVAGVGTAAQDADLE